MVVSPSRFKEHFDVEYDMLTKTLTCNSNYTYHSPRLIYIDQQYNGDDDYRRQSLTNTIDSNTTSNYSSINGQCNLRRQSRVRTRRHHQQQHENDNGSLSSNSNTSIVDWCLKQKSKIATKLRHL